MLKDQWQRHVKLSSTASDHVTLANTTWEPA
jgi:hypothetical protein